MDLNTFILNVAVAVLVAGGSLRYLRPEMQRVLGVMGAPDEALSFWYRTANLLAVSLAVILVLCFGGTRELAADSLGDILRSALLWSIFASALTVACIARTIWKSRPTDCASRDDALAEPEAI